MSLSSKCIRSAASLLAAFVVAFAAGCASVEKGTEKTVAFVRGDVNAVLDAGYDASVRATRVALQRLKFTLEGERGDALQTVFTARTALDKKIEILLTRRDAKATAARIRVGAFGEEAVAEALLVEIRERL